MYDAGKIIGGLAVFAGLVTWPVWYTAGHGKLGYVPELQKPAEAKQCVESTAFMRSWHMDLLNDWRDAVVRDGDHVYVASDGKRHDISLKGACLRCHAEPAKFCNRCHEYTGVQPYCWDCHQQPKAKGI